MSGKVGIAATKKKERVVELVKRVPGPKYMGSKQGT